MNAVDNAGNANNGYIPHETREDDCRNVQARLTRSVRPGEYPELATDVDQHLDTCECCLAYYRILIATADTPLDSEFEQLAATSSPVAMGEAGAFRNDTFEGGRTAHTVLEPTAMDHAVSRRFNMPEPSPNPLVPSNEPLPFKLEEWHDSPNLPEQVLTHRPQRKIDPSIRTLRKRKTLLVAAVLVAASAAAFLILRNKPTRPSELPRHAELASKAGKALDDGKFEIVIELARECVNLYEPAAVRKEEERKDRKYPEGKVDDVSLRDEILANGTLNDVSACLFYLAQAYRAQKHLEEARGAFEKCSKLKHSRVFDPKTNTFWLPAADSEYWLEHLNDEINK